MLNPIDVKYFKIAVGQSRIKHESSVDIQCRCPICGDSQKSKNKARLHLYFRDGESRVNCFNECKVRNRTMYGFLRDFYPELLEGYRQETFGNRIEEIKLDSMDLLGDFDLDLKHNQECNQEAPSVLFNISSYLGDSEKAYEYVESRGLEWNPLLGDIFIAKDNLTIDGRYYPIKGFVVIPFYCNSKMYGFYSRSLTEHKFFTYMPSRNTDWKMWNYFNIDKSKPVYVFEGVFDALSAYNSGITNVVACCGATPPLSRFEGCDLVMCLDNDLTGKKNSIKYLEKGYKVLYYGDIVYKDMNEMFVHGVDVNSLIMNNVVSGISGIIKIRSSL